MQGEAFGERTDDPARADRVDQNPERRQLVRQRFDESVLCRVHDSRGDGIGLRHLASLADNHDEAASSFFLHQRCHAACEVPGPGDFGTEMPAQLVTRDFVHATRQVRTGVAHHNIDASEALDDVLN